MNGKLCAVMLSLLPLQQVRPECPLRVQPPVAAPASCGTAATIEGRFVPFRYGHFDTWVVRHIKESAVIGGNQKTLYEIGPSMTLEGNTPYTNQGGSPWATSNVLARVSGITKTNKSVYRDTHGKGYCVKMTTHIEQVTVLGVVNIRVLAAGSIFLGDMKEPITSTKDAEKAVNWGVPFRDRPKALRYDYRVALSGEPNRVKQTGFGSKQTVSGRDKAITVLYLQKRTEDAKGQITAKRVGTCVVTYGQSTKGWVEGATYEILYGDIRNHPGYDATHMGLRTCDYARNSKGQSVPVRETGWASPTETPTHLILQFSSSHGGAYVGSPGNTFWVDNAGLVY